MLADSLQDLCTVLPLRNSTSNNDQWLLGLLPDLGERSLAFTGQEARNLLGRSTEMLVLEDGLEIFTDQGKLGTALQVGFTESSVDDGGLVSGVGTDE